MRPQPGHPAVSPPARVTCPLSLVKGGGPVRAAENQRGGLLPVRSPRAPGGRGAVLGSPPALLAVGSEPGEFRGMPLTELGRVDAEARARREPENADLAAVPVGVDLASGLTCLGQRVHC